MLRRLQAAAGRRFCTPAESGLAIRPAPQEFHLKEHGGEAQKVEIQSAASLFRPVLESIEWDLTCIQLASNPARRVY